MPDRYIFNTQPNSYFRGQDIRVEDTETHEVVLVNGKDDMWAVNVKDDLLIPQYPADVRHVIANVLPEGIVDGIAERVKDEWWEEAHLAAQDHGFANIFRAGRSGGWAAVDETQEWEASMLIEPGEARDRFLALAFQLGDLTNAHEAFFAEVRAAMQDLQIELSEYADWVGAEVRSLDGAVFEVAKLDVPNGYGRAALRSASGIFAIAKEAKLVRKANGEVPSRITADPIMEQVFQVIEARGEVTREQLNDWLDAEDDHDPSELYVKHVAPAVNAIEDEIKADPGANTWDRDSFGEVELEPFKKDADGEWPANTMYLFELEDGQMFEDSEGRCFNKVGHGPVQGTVEVVDDDELHAYFDVTIRVEPNPSTKCDLP